MICFAAASRRCAGDRLEARFLGHILLFLGLLQVQRRMLVIGSSGGLGPNIFVLFAGKQWIESKLIQI